MKKKLLLFLNITILAIMANNTDYLRKNTTLNPVYNKHIIEAYAALQPKISLNIDDGQVYSSGSTIDIRGWALNTSGVKAADVYVDGKFIKSLDCNLSRPDVKAAFPEYPNSENSGYDYKITLSNGKHTIRVYNIGNDNKVIYDEVKICVESLQPKMNLEINDGQSYLGGSIIDIRGWALNTSGVKAADVYVDGKFIKSLDCNLSRPDVKNAFPEYPNSKNSGYDYKITLSNGKHAIRVYNIGNDSKVIYNEVKISVEPLQPKMNLEINDGQSYLDGNIIDIRGWALNSPPIKYVDLWIDGKFIKSLDCNLSRPDVKNAFSNYPGAENSGYDYSLKASNCDIGNHTIHAYAMGNNGPLTSTSKTISVEPSNIITYKDSISAADWTYSGLQFITDPTTGVPHSSFNYLNKYADSHANFNIGLSTVSTYMATGDEKYLNTAKASANFLINILPSTGLIPGYSLVNKSVDKNDVTSLGTAGQSTTLEFVAYLARIDSSYIPLMNKLANAIINYGLNKYSNLSWGEVYTNSGKPFKSSSVGYESQLGSVSVSCAEALLAAYETDNTNVSYKNKALSILKSIWNTRNPLTNLIPETWNISNNTIGTNLYPYGDFRYDDMGGSYIRGLMLGYNISQDSELLNILKVYVPALANAVWDTGIDGGAFRYLTNTSGNRTGSVGVEIMHGLFISTLLQADSIIGPNNGNILSKVKTHADHILMTNFGVKNFMIPHMVGINGNYVTSSSDSELGYAVVQYPLGYELLSQKTGDNRYRLRDNQIFNTFLSRHKIGDNINSPKGYLNIVETQPPFGFEYSYSSPEWMAQALYIPSYLLFNSIHPSSGVTIDWQHGSSPSVFGLVCDMPFWDLNNVRVQGKNLHLGKVSGSGSIDLTDMGFGNIKSIKCDGNSYSNFSNSTLNTENGTHSYDISWEN